jgi:hypothetical protein
MRYPYCNHLENLHFDEYESRALLPYLTAKIRTGTGSEQQKVQNSYLLAISR